MSKMHGAIAFVVAALIFVGAILSEAQRSDKNDRNARLDAKIESITGMAGDRAWEPDRWQSPMFIVLMCLSAVVAAAGVAVMVVGKPEGSKAAQGSSEPPPTW